MPFLRGAKERSGVFCSIACIFGASKNILQIKIKKTDAPTLTSLRTLKQRMKRRIFAATTYHHPEVRVLFIRSDFKHWASNQSLPLFGQTVKLREGFSTA